jgi:hypothetical protein
MSLVLDGTNGLSEVDGSAATPAIRGTDTNTGIFFPAADTIAFAEGGAEVARFDSAGNLGIGTSSPGYRLTVKQADEFKGLSLIGAFSANEWGLLVDGSNSLRFSYNAGGANAGERMRIDSSGNLLVGTTSTTAGSRFVVNQADAGNTRAAFVSHAGAFEGLNVICTNASYADICIRSSTSRAANTVFNFFAGSANGVNQFLVRGDGNVQNTNNSYGGISDIKLKENIADATPKLEKLNQVRVVNYNLKGDYAQHKQLGVIAQELEQIFPGLVDETPDRDKDGNDLGTTTKSVKYSVFVPMLIKAIQEQQAIITALTARVEALDARLISLEGTQP